MDVKAWFIDRHTQIAVMIAALCVLVALALDPIWLLTLLALMISVPLIFCGQRLFPTDTSENWLAFSSSDLTRKIVGGALMLIGWSIFLRGVLARTIAALLLWAG